jgi:hypothetical protein
MPRPPTRRREMRRPRTRWCLMRQRPTLRPATLLRRTPPRATPQPRTLRPATRQQPTQPPRTRPRVTLQPPTPSSRTTRLSPSTMLRCRWTTPRRPSTTRRCPSTTPRCRSTTRPRPTTTRPRRSTTRPRRSTTPRSPRATTPRRAPTRLRRCRPWTPAHPRQTPRRPQACATATRPTRSPAAVAAAPSARVRARRTGVAGVGRRGGGVVASATQRCALTARVTPERSLAHAWWSSRTTPQERASAGPPGQHQDRVLVQCHRVGAARVVPNGRTKLSTAHSPALRW